MNVIISYQVKISLFYIIHYTWSFMHSVNIISFRLIRRIRVSTKFKDNHSTSAGIRNLVINLRKDVINLRKDLRNININPVGEAMLRGSYVNIAGMLQH